MDREPINNNVTNNVNVMMNLGGLWLVGWLFTIGFANLGLWRGLLGLLLWPYFVGSAAAPQ